MSNSHTRSPCTRKCGVGEDNVCVGCGRTVREIRIWFNASEEERREILRACSDRLRVRDLRDESVQVDQTDEET